MKKTGIYRVILNVLSYLLLGVLSISQGYMSSLDAPKESTEKLIKSGVLSPINNLQYRLAANLSRIDALDISRKVASTGNSNCQSSTSHLNDFCVYSKSRSIKTISKGDFTRLLLSARGIHPTYEDVGISDIDTTSESIRHYINAGVILDCIDSTKVFHSADLITRGEAFQIANCVNAIPQSRIDTYNSSSYTQEKGNTSISANNNVPVVINNPLGPYPATTITTFQSLLGSSAGNQNGNQSINGDYNIQGSLNIKGSSNLAGIVNMLAGANINGGLNVTGSGVFQSFFSNILNVTSGTITNLSSSFANIINATIRNLTVENIVATGSTQLNTLSVSGASIFNAGVSIGTGSSGGYGLNVNGSANVSGPLSFLGIGNIWNNNGYLNIQSLATSSGMMIGTASATTLALYTNGNERMRITGGGNIGIGTFTPNAKLEINSSSSGASGLRFTQLNANSTGSTLFSGILGINTLGDLGLTTSGALASILCTGTGAGGSILCNGGNNSLSSLAVGSKNDVNLNFNTNNVTRMILAGGSSASGGSLSFPLANSHLDILGAGSYGSVGRTSNSQFTWDTWRNLSNIGGIFQSGLNNTLIRTENTSLTGNLTIGTYGENNTLTYTQTSLHATGSLDIRGSNIAVNSNVTKSGGTMNAYGLVSNVTNGGSGTFNSLFGLYSNVSSNSADTTANQGSINVGNLNGSNNGNGYIATIRGLYAHAYNNSNTGSIGTTYGIDIDTTQGIGKGSVGINYGLNINSSNGATQQRAINYNSYVSDPSRNPSIIDGIAGTSYYSNATGTASVVRANYGVAYVNTGTALITRGGEFEGRDGATNATGIVGYARLSNSMSGSALVGGNFFTDLVLGNTSRKNINNAYGVMGSISNSIGVNSGTYTNQYGGSFSASASANSTSAYGVYTQATSPAKTNYGVYVNVGNASSTGSEGLANNFGVYASGDKNYFAGRVGIGTTAPATKLAVMGDVRVGTSGTNGCIQGFGGATIAGTCSSDERLKTNIFNIDNILDKFSGIDVINYNWNSVAEKLYHNDTQSVQTGYRAQNVESIFPELVTTNSDGYMQVNYSAMNIYAVQAIKELTSKYKTLQNSLDTQSGTIAQLVAKISSGNTIGATTVITNNYTTVIQTGSIENPATVINNAYTITATGGLEWTGTGNNVGDLVSSTQNEGSYGAFEYISQKISEFFNIVREIIVLKITALHGYFDQIFAKKATIDEVYINKLCMKRIDGNSICFTAEQIEAVMSGTVLTNARTTSIITPTNTTPSTETITSTGASEISSIPPTPSTSSETATQESPTETGTITGTSGITPVPPSIDPITPTEDTISTETSPTPNTPTETGTTSGSSI